MVSSHVRVIVEVGGYNFGRITCQSVHENLLGSLDCYTKIRKYWLVHFWGCSESHIWATKTHAYIVNDRKHRTHSKFWK